MYKAIVFAGTTEGYALCEFLAENHVPVYACAATEYGGSLLKENEFLHVSAGRLKTEDMEELFRREAPEIVLDATHPYAAEVTKNIRTACENGSIRYQRVLRPEGEKNREAIYVESTEKAAELRKKQAAAPAADGFAILSECGEENADIEALIRARADAKKAKNFAEADRIRDELKARGIEVTDVPGGAKWKRV